MEHEEMEVFSWQQWSAASSPVIAHFCIDTGFPFLSTAKAPGNNALKLSIADHRATRVILNKNEKTSELLFFSRRISELQVFQYYPGAIATGC
jgi:hypothetical protein